MAQDDQSAGEVEKIKAQLTQLKESHKEKEKGWQETENALRRGISRLTFALSGTDSELDKIAAKLRDAIRENFRTDAILDIVDDIANFVKDYDEQRASSANAASALAQRLLTQLALPDVSRRKAKKLAQRFEQEPESGPLETELVELLNGVIGRSSGTPTPGTGLLDRLFSAFSRPPEPSTEPSRTTHEHARQLLLSLMQRIQVAENDTAKVRTLVSRLDATSDAAEFDEIVSQYAELANTALRGPAIAMEAQGDKNVTHIEEVFIQLVEELAVPAEFVAEANRIKEDLAREHGQADFENAFKSIVNLVTSMRRTLVQEKLELQEFLQQLTVRLQDLDKHLGGTQDQQQTWAEQGRKLEAAVHSQVKDIKTTVHGASDLDQLKNVVSTRLDDLQKHLDEYQNNEVRRQEQLATELAIVKSRLVNVESEADQLRTRLKDKHQQAIIDPLTNTHNRLAYDERVAAEVARWKRYGNPLAIAVLDVDHFKQINDHYGHKAGDKALKLIAQVLNENLRETDFLARYGGEEFAVLVTETSEEGVAGVTEKLRRAVEECKFHYAGKDVPITISGGFTMFREGDTADTAFARADGALYRAKEKGRNQIAQA